MAMIKRLNELQPGMTEADVRGILGDPAQKELKEGRTIFKYDLFKWFHGFKPAYLVFDEAGQLAEWMVDEKEFHERQKLWVKAFKVVQKTQKDD